MTHDLYKSGLPTGEERVRTHPGGTSGTLSGLSWENPRGALSSP